MTRLKPYAAMKDSGVPWLGAVPSHWDVEPIARIGLLFKGRGGSKEDEVSSGVPCVRYGDLYTRHEFFINSAKAFVSRDRATAYTRIRQGDALFAASGETVEDIGRSAVNLMSVEAVCGGDVIVLRPSRNMNPRFLGYAADAPSSRNQKSTMGRGFTIVHIYGSELKRLALAIPPLPEQAAIVRFLDHADRRIRRYIRAKQKLIKLLDEQVTARAAVAMRHAACETERLGRIAIQHLRSVARDDAQVYVALGLYNRGRGIFHKAPTPGAELGDSTFFWVKSGDLVISGQFAWEGAVALASSAEENAIVSHRYYLVRGIEGRSTTLYLLGLLRSDFGAMLLDQHSRGAAGRNRPLNISTLLKERVPVPPFEEQLALNDFVQSITPIRAQAMFAISLLDEYRIRLIADIVTGQLDVREAAARLPNEAEDLDVRGEVDTEAEIGEASDDLDAVVAEADA